jgi:hypothetical protein
MPAKRKRARLGRLRPPLVIFSYGHWLGHMSFVELFQAVVGIAVSLIPEGLLESLLFVERDHWNAKVDRGEHLGLGRRVEPVAKPGKALVWRGGLQTVNRAGIVLLQCLPGSVKPRRACKSASLRPGGAAP